MTKNSPQHTEVIKKRFERDAIAFDAIYDRDKSEFSTWFNKVFRKPIFERYDVTFQEMGDLKNKTVLDVGCGSGVYSIQCAMNGAESVKGIDFSQPMLDIAIQRAKENKVADICQFELNDFLQMDLKERFNFVIALGVFDYLIDPYPFLKKMKLAAKTKIIASFPGYSLIRTPLRKLRYLITAKGKIHFYDYEEIKSLVDKVQFSNAEIRPLKTGSGYVLIAEI